MIYIHVLGEAIILIRRCSYSMTNSQVEECTDDTDLIRKFVFAEHDTIKADVFALSTARGNLCVCRTDACNNAPFEHFENIDIAANGASVMVVTDSIKSSTSYYPDTSKVSIDNVTEYRMSYTGRHGTTAQKSQVAESNDKIQAQPNGVCTVDNPTTRGVAAEQVNYNKLLLIIAAILCLLVLVIN